MRFLLLLLATPCFAANVQDFGATPNDGTDDTAAIQAAIDSGEDVYIPAGRYILSKSAVHWALDIGGVSNVSIYGESGTVLELAPNQDNATRMFSSYSGPIVNVTIRDLFLKSGQQSENKQRHGLFIANASGLTLRNIKIRAFTGDGIYLYRDNDGVTVDSVDVRGNGRNGITFGGPNRNVVVKDSVFAFNKSQQVDSEASRDDEVSNISIVNNRIRSYNDFALTAGGTYYRNGKGWYIANNFIRSDGKAVRIIYAEDILFTGNRVVGPLQVYNANTSVVISDNRIYSDVLVIGTRPELVTDTVVMIGNIINGLIRSQGAKHTLIYANRISGNIYTRTTFPMQELKVIGNVVDGSLNMNGDIDDVCVSGNAGLEDNC